MNEKLRKELDWLKPRGKKDWSVLFFVSMLGIFTFTTSAGMFDIAISKYLLDAEAALLAVSFLNAEIQNYRPKKLKSPNKPKTHTL